jgi:hypothetical protein
VGREYVSLRAQPEFFRKVGQILYEIADGQMCGRNAANAVRERAAYSIALPPIDAIASAPCPGECAFRNHIIEQDPRAGASREISERLVLLNSVLSVVLGCHFPLGDVPWHELEQARSWLRDLAAEAP